MRRLLILATIAITLVSIAGMIWFRFVISD
jgi:hypothetical protein